MQRALPALSMGFSQVARSHSNDSDLHLSKKRGYDETFDVVVVGSGAGGLSTAVTAALSGGLKVLVVEKSRWFGGTSAFSGGALWIPASHLARAHGFADSQEKAQRYLRNFLGADYDEAMVSAYLDSGPKMVEWMETNRVTRFFPTAYPDYYEKVDGSSKGGRTLMNVSYDGRQLGDLVRRVRYPMQGYCAFGSMQTDFADLEIWKHPLANWQNAKFVTRALLRYTSDLIQYGKGTVFCNGNALVGRLLESAQEAGVTLWNNTSVVDSILEVSRVTGVVIRRDSQDFRIRAEKGVVLASGGFARSSELSSQYLPNQDWTSSVRGAQGDGIKIGTASGGSLASPLGERAAIWTPISEFRARSKPSRMYPHFTFGLGKPGSLIVDEDGRRFLNESAPYMEVGRAAHAAGVRKEYLIGDARHLRQYGMGVALPAPYPLYNVLGRGYLISAPSIPELASKLDIEPEKLSATVERFNGFAREGIDHDFSRGEASYDKVNGDASHKPNPCLGPLEKGPFYALPMYPGNAATMYGLNTNRDAQVLDKSGRAVPGLYAVGADANHFLKGHYPGNGLTLGPAMVFGYRAGLHLLKT